MISEGVIILLKSLDGGSLKVRGGEKESKRTLSAAAAVVLVLVISTLIHLFNSSLHLHVHTSSENYTMALKSGKYQKHPLLFFISKGTIKKLLKDGLKDTIVNGADFLASQYRLTHNTSC